MNDEILGHLLEARAKLVDEREQGNNSRELSIVLTEVETAILWRQYDLQLKKPANNDTNK